MRPCWPCSAHTLSLYMRIPSKGVRNVGSVKEHALRRCRGRRFGVLEGGYNHSILGDNVASFLGGLGD